MDDFLAAVWAISPTIVVGLFLWFLLRAILRQDRNERQVYQQIREEELAKFRATQAPETQDPDQSK